ncbi:MAG TPA: hypothetical protein VHR86_02375 [Armatimonadota bacterium]|nr:hypothetical protein [Armatimonadota bacterium]
MSVCHSAVLAMGNRLSKTVNGVLEGYAYNNANMHLTRGAASYDNGLNGYSLIGDMLVATPVAQFNVRQRLSGNV